MANGCNLTASHRVITHQTNTTHTQANTHPVAKALLWGLAGLLVATAVAAWPILAHAQTMQTMSDMQDMSGSDKASQADMATIENTQSIDPKALAFFETKIRPVLVNQCYDCHATSGTRIRGGLLLDTRAGLHQGGDSGPAIDEENPSESILLQSLKHEGGHAMPPKGKLPASVIQDFETWLNMGAPDPRSQPNPQPTSGHVVGKLEIIKGRQFWSLQPLANAQPPATQTNKPWAQTPIDAFIEQGHQQQNLRPAPDADAETLARRLHLDLTGLPPTHAQTQAFVDAYKQNPTQAIESTVDRLLESPTFGEHWGKAWLDWVRYAESAGKELNLLYPHAWRYRDYVIDAFNQDKPYNQFLVEQIAGDLLPSTNETQRYEQTVATGLLAIGPKTLTELRPQQFEMDTVDDQIDVTTRVFLGLSVACARCHDHKYEAIPQSDYYAMAGFFTSTESMHGTAIVQQNRRPGELIAFDLEDETPWALSMDAKTIQDKKDQLAELRQSIQDSQREIRELRRQSGPDATQRQRTLTRARIVATASAGLIERELEAVNANGQARVVCMGVQDAKQTGNTKLLNRGEIDQPGNTIPRRFPQLLCADLDQPKSFKNSGRLALAQWMAEQPITARVQVNRIWQQLLGQGLVTTEDDFGTTGAAPTHPELLEWLAKDFVDHGQSIKHTVKAIVTSRVYRLASQHDANNFAADPENHALWRANNKRLRAEQIRDSILLLTGQLNPEPIQGTLVAVVGDDIRQARRLNPNAESSHRSVYLPVVRDQLPDAMAIFDAAEPTMVVSEREQSPTAQQALFMLNNDWLYKQCQTMAQQLIEQAPDQRGAQLRLALETIYGRTPTRAEFRLLQDFEKQHRNNNIQAWQQTLAQACQALFASNDFLHLN